MSSSSVTRTAAGALVALLGSAGMLVATSSPALACDCPAPEQVPVSRSAKQADTVFTGTLLYVGDATTRGRLSYTVRADEVFKGHLVSTDVTFTSSSFGPSCGLGRLPVDQRYVVFVTGKAGSWTADSCGGTTTLTSRLERELVAALGEPTRLTAGPAEPFEVERTVVEQSPPPTLRELLTWPAGVALGGLVLLGVAVLLGRPRRS